MIDKDGHACLMDYGLSSIYLALWSHEPFSEMLRWSAPEIIGSTTKPVVRGSKEADVFAFGMVMVEVFSCNVPFFEKDLVATALSITEKERPSKPEELTEGLWNLTQQCWEEDPCKRPTMEVVVEKLQEPVGDDGESVPLGK